MKESIEMKMRNAVRVFKRNAEAPADRSTADMKLRLSDNYYILERRAQQAAADCRRAEKALKGSDLFPGLFARCTELCKDGLVPDEDGITDFFSENGLDGISSGYLSLAVTCALVDSASKSVRMKNTKHLSNAIDSLRKLSEIDFGLIAERLFKAEEILLKDPAGIYSSMDKETKSFYRRSIAVSAFKSGKTEMQIASKALKKAEKSGKHIGFYVIDSNRKPRNGRLYLIMGIVMPLAAAVAAGLFFAQPAVAVFLFFPFWEIFRRPIETASLRGVAPVRFPRLDVDCESVKQAHVMLSLSVLLPPADRMQELEERLEQHYISNCGGNIKVCCLADFKAAGMPRRPDDKYILKAAKETIDRLNRKYGGGFIIAVRPRSYSETQNEFIGKERKRGAITELIRAIKGKSKGFLEIYGDNSEFDKVRYLFALDWDTCPVFDSARELISIALHPLNRPKIAGGRVVSGYGLLVPKTENRLKSKKETWFSALMSGNSGVMSYDGISGERYQDLFGESIFCGKGLIDVDAYYELLDRGLPRETILSHDIVESGYLRAGYVSDVQITEAFPKTVSAYYQRLHRWVRGDWQNIKFIFGKNPMNGLSRYKMLDNLRRSLTPAICVSAILFSAVIQGYEGITVAAFAMLALCADELYSILCSIKNGGIRAVTGLYFSKTLPSALEAAAGGFVSVAFSAREGFVCADAAFRALWRLFVSGDRLLEWTTAAQNERNESTGRLLVSCIPSILTASALLLLGLPIHRLAGLIILADIPLTLFSGAKIKDRKFRITEIQRESLLSYAGEMWGFFDEQCGKENNFLPPDNIQFSPARAVAQRTSPTNIGLMLACFLAVRDLGLISTAELYMRLNLSLSTVEKLEKYKGNLLNWYSTVTLEPLNPRFVSTVDSGNFLCCLTAVKEGLREYAAECSQLETIIERIEKLIDETELAPLFDERRKLFYIGIDAQSGAKSGSYYDLYMSEIRMTAYFAVAKRLVPKGLWNAMGRIPVKSGRYTGLASWTGTMFEYFMPNIFLPSIDGSLSSEALYFCLQSQRKRAGKRPYGISESAFYAFDGDLNYQYKAHGVQKLGLKRGLDKETVVSPYSSFLTLTFAPQLSLKNLGKLEKMGMRSKYGFFEAADFTNAAQNGGFSRVSSYMAHHVGMSLLSVDNLLKNQCMQRRFMNDGSMRGAESILEEKCLVSARVFKDAEIREIPAIRERVHGKNTVSENPNPFYPKAMLLTNGRMTTCITDAGTGVSLFDGIDITVNSHDPVFRPQGVFGFFITETERLSFARATATDEKQRFGAEFSKNFADFSSGSESAKLKMRVKLYGRQNGEVRTFTVENRSHKRPLEGWLIVYFEPCLEKRAAYAAHPMFSKLFLTDEWDEESGCCLFSRRARDSDIPCSVAAGFLQETEASHETSREKVLKTPNGIFSIGEKTDFGGERGNPDCCCAFELKITLKPGEKVSYDFAIVVDETKEQALNAFLSIKFGKMKSKYAENPFFGDSVANAIADRLLPCAIYPKLSENGTRAGEKCNFKKSDLWSFGISGEIPIILIKINSEESAPDLAPYLRFNRILRSSGIATDLAVLYSDRDGYTSPIEESVRGIIKKEGCSLMAGVSGGIHTVNSSDHSYQQLCALHKNAVYVSAADDFSAKGPKKSFRQLKTVTSDSSEKAGNYVKVYNFTDSKITIEKTQTTVDIPWIMVLSNRSFGTMISDKALGFTWALNSRENKLTPWYNDTMSDNRGEMLILKYNGVLYDLISIGKAELTPEKAVWCAEIENLAITVSVSVPSRGMTKKCSVKIINKSEKSEGFDLLYYTLPVLGVSREGGGALFVRRQGDAAVAENSGADIPGFMSLECENAEYFCFSRKSFFEGSFNSDTEIIPKDCCIAVGRNFEVEPGDKAEADFFLSWGTSEKAALLMPKVSDFAPAMLNPQKIRTKDKKLNLFFNSFLYSQIKQSRFWGRTGFYQCSGAYGFRDQLQDCLAFIDFEPELAFTHIVRCAAVQFEKGDVLHWWHVVVDKRQLVRGIRTRCSDDMLWLPYACIEFFEKTGDISIFEVKAPYLNAKDLSEGEKERYCSPERTDYSESLLNHCIRAIDYSLNFGKNGLPLIGSCDWNDGFSRVGEAYHAESVWLAMFQKLILEKMSDICLRFNMREKAEEYADLSAKTEAAILKNAWQGDRFARLIAENGEKIGASKDFIDILPQAFSVFSNIGSGEQQAQAVLTAYERLFDEKSGVIRLLSPPFNAEEREKIGYIASYPEGIRENGGQYTHSAVWLALAMLRIGKKDEAFKLISAINPISFYSDERLAQRYRAEPYVLAGDISFGEGITGRAGWSHFTGSAAWFYRCVAEYVAKNEQTAQKDCKVKALYNQHQNVKTEK